jgi:hypothetical protein
MVKIVLIGKDGRARAVEPAAAAGFDATRFILRKIAA